MKRMVYFDTTQRAVAATMIEGRLTAICRRLALCIDRFVWNHGKGMSHVSPHLLDITVAEHVIRMYFTDQELACYWGEPVSMGTDARLEALCSSLQRVLHAPDTPRSSTGSSSRTRMLQPSVGLHVLRNASRGKKYHG